MSEAKAYPDTNHDLNASLGSAVVRYPGKFVGAWVRANGNAFEPDGM